MAIGKNAAQIAAMTLNTMIPRFGVRDRSFTRLKASGSMPSRAIWNVMRDWP